MNLLLLLSALLSALSGVAGGSRALQVPQAVSREAIMVSPARVAAARIVARPVAALPSRATIAAAPVVEPASRETAPALLTNRRRE